MISFLLHILYLECWSVHDLRLDAFQIRERVLSKVRSGKEDLSLEDVVHAFSVPDIRQVCVLMFSSAMYMYECSLVQRIHVHIGSLPYDLWYYM